MNQEECDRYNNHYPQMSIEEWRRRYLNDGFPQTNTTKTVAIDQSYHWRPIDQDTPLGVKVQLISRGRSGVASYGILGSANTWFTHWAPLPTFKKD